MGKTLINYQDKHGINTVEVIDGLPADWKLHVLHLARSQAHQSMVEARESLRGRVQDASAEYKTSGFASSPPSEAEFIRAYGQADGAKQYRDFQDVAKLGQTLQQVRTLPSAALSDLLASSKPTPGEGFAARQHNYEILTKAIANVVEARTKDPVAYAITTGRYAFKPIQRFDDPQAVMRELALRTAAAPQLAVDYGTRPRLLTEGESRAMSATLKAGSVEGQKQLLSTIAKGIGDIGLIKATMQSIAPDSPTIAVAGIYQARGLRTTENRDVADATMHADAMRRAIDQMLRGEQVMVDDIVRDMNMVPDKAQEQQRFEVMNELQHILEQTPNTEVAAPIPERIAADSPVDFGDALKQFVGRLFGLENDRRAEINPAEHSPESLKARQFAQEQPDLVIPLHYADADGAPVTMRAADAIALADTELAQARAIAPNLFKTAAHCLLGVL